MKFGGSCSNVKALAIGVLFILVLSCYCVEQKRTRVYWFHRNGCPACMKMKAEWEKFENMTNASMVKTIRVETTDPRNHFLAENFGVSTVPHIVKVKNDVREVFTGDRTAGQILAWSKK